MHLAKCVTYLYLSTNEFISLGTLPSSRSTQVKMHSFKYKQFGDAIHLRSNQLALCKSRGHRKTTWLGMRSGRAGLVTKGPVFEKTSRKSSSMFESDVLLELGELPSLAGKSENPVVYENTYKLSPDVTKTFSPAVVKGIADGVLHEMLSDMEYDPKVCRELSLEISDDIVRKVTALGFHRYKIMCLTTIGQKVEQTVRIGSQCCWDPKVDNYSESVFMNRSVFAVSVVYGLYQE